MRDYSVFDALAMGVQIVSADMRYLYLNKQLEAEVGQDRAELVGQRMVDKFPGIDTTDIYAAIAECMQTQQTRKFVNEFTFEGGRVTYYELELHRIEEGVLIFSRDITESKRGELLLRETAKNQEHFAHIAAHDMREPVRRMMLLAEELELEAGPDMNEDARELCGQLGRQSKLLMELINDFRSLSGIAGSRHSDRESTSLQEQVSLAAESLTERFAQTGMRVELPSNDAVVSAFPSMVRILLRNLLDNAIRHGHTQVVVRIDASQSPPVVVVTNPTHQAPLGKDPFLPFVGHDRTRHTGLGLAIAKRVTGYHGGAIWAEHSADQHFSVSFTLAPRAEPAEG